MNDLVQRLRDRAESLLYRVYGLPDNELYLEAADRIEALENELERNEGIFHLRQKRIEALEAALRECAKCADPACPHCGTASRALEGR